MVNESGVGLLNDFYEVRGNGVVLGKFGFYEGDLNGYKGEYWKEEEKGIVFEEGKG